MLKTIELTLDIDKGDDRFSTLDERIELRQGDALAYVLDVYLREESEVLDLTGKVVRLYARMPNSTIVDGANVDVVSAEEGHIQYPIPREFTEALGNIDMAYFRITDEEPGSEWSASTPNIPFYIRKGVALKVRDEDYFPEFDGLMADLEASRVAYGQSEDAREANETARIAAETARATAERERLDAEDRRIAAEAGRKDAEASRVDGEELRISAEGERIAAEEARATAEAARAAAEDDRDSRQAANDTAQARNNADQAANNLAAQASRYIKLAADQYDHETGLPLLDAPEQGVTYLVPKPGGGSYNKYDGWLCLIGDDGQTIEWELVGPVEPTPALVTTDDVDKVVAGEPVGSDLRVVGLNVLPYLWAKIKSAILLAGRPVGYIYQSLDPKSPADIYGGQWEPMDGYILRASMDDVTPDTTKTGGSDTVTLGVANLPAHAHSVGAHSHGVGTIAASGGRHEHSVLLKYTPGKSGNVSSGGGAKFSSDGTNWSAIIGEAKTYFNGGKDSAHAHTMSGATAASAAFNTGSAGSGAAFDNRPYYKNVYTWVRVA